MRPTVDAITVTVTQALTEAVRRLAARLHPPRSHRHRRRESFLPQRDLVLARALR